LFELFPSLEVETKEYFISQLDFFSFEMLRNELVTVMIPRLVQEATTNNETEILGYKLLMTYADQPPSYSTILGWLHILKFTYCTKRKS
jgi:hypothetical protein